jgi:hypothetical protein
MNLTVELFKPEMAEALRAYDKHIVCIEKTPEEFGDAVARLMDKAIKAFVDRDPSLRHGIALDKQITIILSQAGTDRPLCGIYFNLHSPYQKKSAARS